VISINVREWLSRIPDEQLRNGVTMAELLSAAQVPATSELRYMANSIGILMKEMGWTKVPFYEKGKPAWRYYPPPSIVEQS
jgi:hypothetical protein